MSLTAGPSNASGASGNGEAVLPRVTVVMATNRVSPYFREALESLVAQDYPNVERIVVDDGCPDRAGLDAVLRDYPDLIVRHIPASGVSTACNIGVGMGHGDLLAFLDDDDRYPPGWISAHVQCHLAHPEIVLSVSGVRVIDANGEVLFVEPVPNATDKHAVLRGDVGIFGGSLLVKRSAFLAVGGFDPAFRNAQDLDVVLRCADLGPFGYVPDVVRDYRTHSGNVTGNHRRLAANIERIVRLHRAAAADAGRTDEFADYDARLAANRRFAWWSAARAAGRHVRDGQLGRAIGDIWWAARFAPTGPIDVIRHRTARALQGWQR